MFHITTPNMKEEENMKKNQKTVPKMPKLCVENGKLVAVQDGKEKQPPVPKGNQRTKNGFGVPLMPRMAVDGSGRLTINDPNTME